MDVWHFPFCWQFPEPLQLLGTYAWLLEHHSDLWITIYHSFSLPFWPRIKFFSLEKNQSNLTSWHSLHMDRTILTYHMQPMQDVLMHAFWCWFWKLKVLCNGSDWIIEDFIDCFLSILYNFLCSDGIRAFCMHWSTISFKKYNRLKITQNVSPPLQN